MWPDRCGEPEGIKFHRIEIHQIFQLDIIFTDQYLAEVGSLPTLVAEPTGSGRVWCPRVARRLANPSVFGGTSTTAVAILAQVWAQIVKVERWRNVEEFPLLI